MPSLSNIGILRIFLKHHNAHNNYVNNRDGSAPFFLDYPESRVCQMMNSCGFDWKTSPEGAFYWSQLHQKWLVLCKTFDLTNQRAVS